MRSLFFRLPLAAGLAAFLVAVQSDAADLPSKPNILLMVADDLGWADVGYHDSSIPTPNIDRLARDGVQLDQHYVAPMCTPTRAALLTGRFWSRFGNRKPSNERVLPWDTLTLASILKQQGYQTYLSGKWHLGSRAEWGPVHFGFDQSYGSLAGGVGPWNHRYKNGDFTHTWHHDDHLIKEVGHVTDLLGNQTIRWIHRASDASEPFFLYVPFTAPHHPLQEPEEWLKRAAAIAPAERVQYTACVMHLDDTIGRIHRALESTNQTNNTLTIFISDNGGTIGAANSDNANYPGAYLKDQLLGRNEPLRGRKGQLYEGGIRVPAIVHWPVQLRAHVLEEPVHVTDWTPTLAALTGFKPKEALKWDGEDIWPLLNGARKERECERILYWQGVKPEAAAIREGPWKLIVDGSQGHEQLFDLGKDPNETTNLAEQHPGKVAALRQLLADERARDNDALPTDGDRP